jgi:hypothetical protein
MQTPPPYDFWVNTLEFGRPDFRQQMKPPLGTETW